MQVGLLFAFVAAAAAAAGTVLQAIGARQAHSYATVDPRLLVGVLRRWPYLLGLVLLGASFVFTLIALRTTALAVVQALIAASIVGIAAASSFIFRRRLHWAEWTAVALTCGGVAILVVTQKQSTAPALPQIGAWAALIAAAGITVIALGARRLLTGAAVPGLLSGLAFGDNAVASRMISQLDGSARALLASPATYAIVLSGVIGTLLYTTALQRGSVTAVFGLSTVGQTVGPAITGWLVLGDGVQSGTMPLAAVGFGLAVAGALSLGRHAQIERHTPELRPVAVPHLPALPQPARAPIAGR
ncbi:MAG TPA: hypothetical protein VGJ28_11640 [Micromonosporaceae bacterium]|jgi:drug/metabolite transporter (DMT)-like permease